MAVQLLSMKRNRTLPYLTLAAGIAALSLSAMFVRWADAPGAITGFYRVFIFTILFTPVFARQQRRHGRIERRYLFFPIAAGLFTALDFAVWNTSVQYTTAANATLLGNTSPLWVALFAYFVLGERLPGSFWLGLILALSGAALVVGSDFVLHPTLGIGDLMAATAAVFYASYQLITQRGRRHMDPFRYTWLVGISATASMFVINLSLGNSFTGYDRQTWLVFLATAVVSQMIGYLSISYALGHLPASIVAPTLVGQPILTAILAVPLLGEIPRAAQWAGGAIALAGIYIVNRSYAQSEKELPSA